MSYTLPSKSASTIIKALIHAIDSKDNELRVIYADYRDLVEKYEREEENVESVKFETAHRAGDVLRAYNLSKTDGEMIMVGDLVTILNLIMPNTFTVEMFRNDK